MEVPREPTVIPQARRYSRTFSAIQGKAFRENDQITVEIPRIDKTYLSKNVKLHFDFDLTYQEASQVKLSAIYADIRNGDATDASAILANNYFGRSGVVGNTTLDSNPVFAYTKPIPTFDINGPYGLISRIQVFSYLNNTLLEDVQDHHLLTAQFTDFWLRDENMDVDRPYITDTTTTLDYQTPLRKQPCANLIPAGSTILTQPFAISSVNNLTNTVTPATRSVSLHCELDLFSFLGRFSDKFVPLHNGFKIVFTLSKFTDAIVFNTLYGDNKVFYRRFGEYYEIICTPATSTTITLNSNDIIGLVNNSNPGTTTYYRIAANSYASVSAFSTAISTALGLDYTVTNDGTNIYIQSKYPFSFMPFKSTADTALGLSAFNTTLAYQSVGFAGFSQLDSSIVSASVSNMYIKGELLEVSPELDSKVDKMVYFQSYKYQRDFFPYDDFSNGADVADQIREPFTRRILPDLKSITKVFVGQRPVDYPTLTGRQKLGYRIKNYCKGGRLLFNKTEVCTIKNDQEAWASFSQAMPMRIDPYLNMKDFLTQEEDATGTNGNQVIIPSAILKTAVETAWKDQSNTVYDWFAGFSGSANYGTATSSYSPLSTLHQGRYLLAFDTRIPGATENSIAGIDSSKAILEYEIVPESDVCWKVNIDIFVEHDAFLHVDPGKSTSVTF